ncbi:MAG: hypothetical protein V4671_24865 [Armatimonadota bacterium]
MALAPLFFSSAGSTDGECRASPGEAAQTNKVSKPTNASANENRVGFEVLFAEFAHTHHAALICESRPLSLTLSDEEAKALQQALSVSDRTIDQKIAVLASSFDYEAVPFATKVFLLRKRFTDPNDLPEVTLPEADISLRNILQATSAFDSKEVHPAGLVRTILAAATPEQKVLLAKGVPIADLPPSLQAAAWQLSSFRDVGYPLSGINKMSRRMASLNRGAASAGMADYLGLSLPFYEGPFGPNGATWKVFLSHAVRTSSGGGTAFLPPEEVTVIEGRIVGTVPDPTAPDKETPPSPQLPPSPQTLSVQKSLGQVAAALSQRLAAAGVPASDGRITRVEADSVITRKTVCLFGESDLTPAQLLEGVTQIYKLRAVKYKEGVVRITTVRPNVLRRASEIPAEVRRLLPDPFLRALLARSAPTASPTPTVQGAAPVPVPVISTIADSSADKLYIAAVKRLRTMLAAKLDGTYKGSGKKLAWKDLPAEAGDMAALSSLATCYFAVNGLMQPKPAILDNLDRATLTLSLEDGRSVFSILAKSADGTPNGIKGDLP